MSIRLNCISCGHSMLLGDAYEEYEGEIRCWVCRTVQTVVLRDGKLRSMGRRADLAPVAVRAAVEMLAADTSSAPVTGTHTE